MRKFFQIFCPISVFILTAYLGYIRTDGFRTDILSSNVDSPAYKTSVPENFEEIEDILSKPFVYLTRGRQSFVFESLDQKYVIKFLDSSRFKKMYYFEFIPLWHSLEKQRQKHINRRKQRQKADFRSYQIAYEVLKEDTGILFVHLNKSSIFKNKLTIYNKQKQTHELDLDSVVFILQKKAGSFYQTLETSQDSDFDYYLKSFMDMADRRTQKMIIDDDIGKKRRNWGVENNKVITIDVGRFYFDEKLIYPHAYRTEMLKATKTLRRYLTEKKPDKLKDFEHMLHEHFNKFEKNYLTSKEKRSENNL